MGGDDSTTSPLQPGVRPLALKMVDTRESGIVTNFPTAEGEPDVGGSAQRSMVTGRNTPAEVCRENRPGEVFDPDSSAEGRRLDRALDKSASDARSRHQAVVSNQAAGPLSRSDVGVVRLPHAVVPPVAGEPLPSMVREFAALSAVRHGVSGALPSGEAEAPEIHVTIGRIEINAHYDRTPEKQTPASRRPQPMSLDDYLDGRQRRRL